MRILNNGLIVAIGLTVSACSTTPLPTPDPNYAPVRPVESKPLPISDGAIFRTGYEVTLFEDTKARRVGDIITVVLSERTNASKKASTNTAKVSDVSLTGPTVLGRGITSNGAELFSGSLSGDRSFKGEGDTSQSNALTGTISVTVAEVLANGNLIIRGEKLLTLNQGVEHLRLSGIVRPDDISPSNTIVSEKIANAQIIFGGEGTIAESNTKGWLQRVFDSSWWPF